MSKIELKLPPVPLMIIFAVLMWLVSLILPSVYPFSSARVAAIIVLAGLSLFFSLSGVYSFRIAKTTVDPRVPDSTSALVKSGIYGWTRNPMYVGFLFALLAWGIYLSSLRAFILPVGYVAYMNRFQIQPEERALAEIFGKEYLSYKEEVRRWL